MMTRMKFEANEHHLKFLDETKYDENQIQVELRKLLKTHAREVVSKQSQINVRSVSVISWHGSHTKSLLQSGNAGKTRSVYVPSHLLINQRYVSS